ncbi:hypothetical protein PV11_03149 [Exophiala sideris]|uniref:Uncharacterized protein n=1 Tax=Exophiala sideris TaxID=1016849 RepID=A0A0D1WFS6_9EURO|nr:hypothetical protein PV11_03149 [Exophiala sideris]
MSSVCLFDSDYCRWLVSRYPFALFVTVGLFTPSSHFAKSSAPASTDIGGSGTLTWTAPTLLLSLLAYNLTFNKHNSSQAIRSIVDALQDGESHPTNYPKGCLAHGLDALHADPADLRRQRAVDGPHWTTHTLDDWTWPSDLELCNTIANNMTCISEPRFVTPYSPGYLGGHQNRSK